tara:strand:+ start:156120 stop:156644 length:525 start_codon:yes stop_codon:yes gene_type:complete
MSNNQAIETMLAKQAIQETVYTYCRALDRLDKELLESVFSANANIDYGEIYKGPAAGFVDIAIGFQGSMRDTQHMVNNLLIEVDGEEASSEAYVYAHHVIEQDGERMELVIGARYLDRFCRDEQGQWKISYRTELLDWARMVPIGERWFEDNTELPKGCRGKDDLSYGFLNRRK